MVSTLVNADAKLIRWFLMSLLTLAVALAPENSHGAIFWYALIWIVTLIKGRWIILDFMELRHTPACLRHILQGWVLITATAVTLTAVWQ